MAVSVADAAKRVRQMADGSLVVRGRFSLLICPNVYDDSYTGCYDFQPSTFNLQPSTPFKH